MKLICIWWTRAHLLTTEQIGGAVRAINDRPYEIVGKLSLFQSAGLLLPPAQTLAASSIFAPSENADKSLLLHRVGASFLSLAPTFLQKPERTHAAAPPFPITTAALGRDWFGNSFESQHLSLPPLTPPQLSA